MKRMSLRMVMRLTEAWVRFYTIGLPEEMRNNRQDEIKSDIWEHWHDLKRESKPLTEIISRLLRGISADAIWRLEQSERTLVKVFMLLSRSCLKVLAVLAGIFILFPLVTVSFVIALIVMIILGLFIAFPFYYKTGTIILGPWVVDTLGEAVIVSVIGLALLFLAVLIIKGISRLVSRHISLRIGRLHLGWSE